MNGYGDGKIDNIGTCFQNITFECLHVLSIIMS